MIFLFQITCWPLTAIIMFVIFEPSHEKRDHSVVGFDVPLLDHLAK